MAEMGDLTNFTYNSKHPKKHKKSRVSSGEQYSLDTSFMNKSEPQSTEEKNFDNDTDLDIKEELESQFLRSEINGFSNKKTHSASIKISSVDSVSKKIKKKKKEKGFDEKIKKHFTSPSLCDSETFTYSSKHSKKHKKSRVFSGEQYSLDASFMNKSESQSTKEKNFENDTDLEIKEELESQLLRSEINEFSNKKAHCSSMKLSSVDLTSKKIRKKKKKKGFGEKIKEHITSPSLCDSEAFTYGSKHQKKNKKTRVFSGEQYSLDASFMNKSEPKYTEEKNFDNETNLDIKEELESQLLRSEINGFSNKKAHSSSITLSSVDLVSKKIKKKKKKKGFDETTEKHITSPSSCRESCVLDSESSLIKRNLSRSSRSHLNMAEMDDLTNFTYNSKHSKKHKKSRVSSGENYSLDAPFMNKSELQSTSGKTCDSITAEDVKEEPESLLLKSESYGIFNLKSLSPNSTSVTGLADNETLLFDDLISDHSTPRSRVLSGSYRKSAGGVGNLFIPLKLNEAGYKLNQCLSVTKNFKRFSCDDSLVGRTLDWIYAQDIEIHPLTFYYFYTTYPNQNQISLLLKRFPEYKAHAPHNPEEEREIMEGFSALLRGVGLRQEEGRTLVMNLKLLLHKKSFARLFVATYVGRAILKQRIPLWIFAKLYKNVVTQHGKGISSNPTPKLFSSDDDFNHGRWSEAEDKLLIRSMLKHVGHDKLNSIGILSGSSSIVSWDLISESVNRSKLSIIARWQRIIAPSLVEFMINEQNISLSPSLHWHDSLLEHISSFKQLQYFEDIDWKRLSRKKTFERIPHTAMRCFYVNATARVRKKFTDECEQDICLRTIQLRSARSLSEKDKISKNSNDRISKIQSIYLSEYQRLRHSGDDDEVSLECNNVGSNHISN